MSSETNSSPDYGVSEYDALSSDSNHHESMKVASASAAFAWIQRRDGLVQIDETTPEKEDNPAATMPEIAPETANQSLESHGFYVVPSIRNTNQG